jgi:hypothetical protein
LSALKNTKNAKTAKTAIIMIASIMVIVGTSFTPILQQQVNAAVGQVRSQHMNQENLCFRSITCRQSDVGENTLGNDNSVTGFADQSDNIQQSTTANKATPTPTPTPTTASLTVIKIVSGTTTATSSDFAIHVSGINPTPANFNGSRTGTDVTLSPGTFNVTETPPPPNFTTSFSSECSGTITAGQHLTCTITNTAKTCEECFTTFLNQTEIASILSFFDIGEGEGGLTGLCSGGFFGQTETEFRTNLISGLFGFTLDVTTADELIACLKGAGIVFALG